MAILTYPSTLCNPSSMRWSLKSNTQTFTSPFNQATQTVGMSGQIWSASYVYKILNESKYNILNPFIMQLRGMAGRFYLSPAHYTNTLATGLTATTADTISIALSAPVADLVVGNYISINNELKMIVTKTDDSNYKIEPPFRQLYTAQPIELNNPSCIMMLAKDDFDMNFTPPVIQNVSIDFIEAIDI